MAYVQHVAINQRHQRQHHSLSGLDPWAGQQEPVDYSLPYPPPRFRDDIQRADRYSFDQAVLSPRRASEKMRTRESLPSRGHHREPAAASRRDGREPMVPRQSDPRRGQSSRVRSRSASTSGTSSEEELSTKTRSRSLSVSSSESESASKSASGSESVDSGIATPRSAHEERSASESKSASSSESESEEDSLSESSEEDSPPPETAEEKARRRRREKEAIRIKLDPKASSSRRYGHERGRKAREPVIHEVESDASDASDARPRVAEPARGGKVLQKRRHKHHSPSKAVSQRHHRHRDRHGEIRPASSAKRYLSSLSFPFSEQELTMMHLRAMKKVYESGPVYYSPRRSLTRSQTTYSSQSHASSRRSNSTILGSFFGSSATSHRDSKPTKLYVFSLQCSLP